MHVGRLWALYAHILMEQLVLGRQPAGQTHPDDSSVELQAGEKMHGASEKAALT